MTGLDMRTYSGVVQERTARQTGTTVLVIDNRDKQFSAAGEWLTLCDDHGGICSHDTRKLAAAWASDPEGWCPRCQEIRDKRRAEAARKRSPFSPEQERRIRSMFAGGE
jgi:hypothetical protein